MLNNVLARIKSAPKAALAAIVVTVAVFIVLAALWPSSQTKAVVNGHSYAIEIADTDATREQGLGGRDSLPADAGMLFVFSRPGQQCFWMKDMRFDLDIIWLNTGHKVVHIEHDVSPATYPDSFCPAKSAKYVLELNAGEAKRAGIKQGSVIAF